MAVERKRHTDVRTTAPKKIAKANAAAKPQQAAEAAAPVAEKAKLHAPRDDDAFVAPQTAPLPRGTQLAVLLTAEGTSVAAARKGLVRALSTELLLPTTMAVEEQASAIFASLRAGQSVDAAQAVRAAFEGGGAAAVAELAAAFAWRVAAAAADGAPAGLVDKGNAAGDALVKAGVALLAAHEPTSTPDAVATMVAQSALLSGGQTAQTAYFAPANLSYAHHFDAFTNEPTLPGAIAKLGATGGAMVGVSGGALQTAAQIRADAAVITDINPEIRDFVLVFATAMRVLVDQVDASGGGAADLLTLLNLNLVGPERGNPAFLDALRAAGLPEPLLARAPTMFARLYNESGMNRQQVWLLPKPTAGAGDDDAPWLQGWQRGNLGIATAAGGTPEEIEAQVRAIAALVKKGALVAAVVDLSDDDGPRRVSTFLQAKSAPVNALHLSNALDYVVDPKSVLQGLAQLDVTPEATVLSSCAGAPSDRRIGDWYNAGVNAWKTWMEPGGIKDAMRPRPLSWSQQLQDAFVSPAQATPAQKILADPAALRAAIERAIGDHYADASRAMRSLVDALVAAAAGPAPPYRSDNEAARTAWSARRDALAASVPVKLHALHIGAPKGPDDVRGLVRALAPLFA